MVFGVLCDSLILAMGFFSFKEMRGSRSALKTIEREGNDHTHLEIRQKRTGVMLRLCAINTLAISLLICIQIGLNFITIEKGQ